MKLLRRMVRWIAEPICSPFDALWIVLAAIALNYGEWLVFIVIEISGAVASRVIKWRVRRMTP